MVRRACGHVTFKLQGKRRDIDVHDTLSDNNELVHSYYLMLIKPIVLVQGSKKLKGNSGV